MKTFKAYFRKEILESIRQYRYVVLGAGFIFFAILDPLMQKLLPLLLKNEIPPEMLDLLSMQFNPMQVITTYFKDISQLIYFIVTLGLMGSLSDELKEQRLVFPYSKGAKASGLVLAKFTHYALVLLVFIFTGIALNHYYTHVLFTGEKVGFGAVMGSAALIAVYYFFTLALLLLLSSFFKRGIGVAITVLIIAMFMPLFGKISALQGWLPSTLIAQANLLNHADWGIVRMTIVTTVLYIVILQWLTIRRMKKVEVI